MSSWDANPWSNFCDPHWELICCNKWHSGNSPEIAVGTHFHARCGTKTASVFLLVDGETSWLLLPSSITLLSCGTVQLENTYSCILKGYVSYFLSNFYFFTIDSPSKTMKNVFISSKKLFSFSRYSNFRDFSLPFHTFQFQKDKSKWNNLCHELTCINLQM